MREPSGTALGRGRSVACARRRACAWIGVVALASALAGCGGSSHTPSFTSTASYATLLGAGAHLLRAGNTSAARQLFQQAVDKSPQGTVAHYDLGVIDQAAGDRRDAVLQYNQALAADPRYVPALYNQAVLRSASNPPLAMFYYRQVIHLQPDSPTARLNLGLLEAAAKGLHEQAIVDLRAALKLDPALRSRLSPALVSAIAHAPAAAPVHAGKLKRTGSG